jgi:hypothetical protein
MTDSAGNSDIVFGLFWLLGFLANRSQSELWCAKWTGSPSSQNHSNCPALGRSPPGSRLSQNGNRSSFGTHPQSATRRPSLYPRARHRRIRPHPQDLAYRRHILNQLNRGEGRGRLSRRVFYGQRGELRQRYREVKRTS